MASVDSLDECECVGTSAASSSTQQPQVDVITLYADTAKESDRVYHRVSRRVCNQSALLRATLEDTKQDDNPIAIHLSPSALDNMIRMMRVVDAVLSSHERLAVPPSLSLATDTTGDAGTLFIPTLPNPFDKVESSASSRIVYAQCVSWAMRQELLHMADDVLAWRNLVASTNYTDTPLLRAIALHHYQLSIRSGIFTLGLIPKCTPQLLAAFGIEWTSRDAPVPQVTINSFVATKRHLAPQAVAINRSAWVLEHFRRTRGRTQDTFAGDMCTPYHSAASTIHGGDYLWKKLTMLGQRLSQDWNTVRDMCLDQWRLWEEHLTTALTFSPRCPAVWVEECTSAMHECKSGDETIRALIEDRKSICGSLPRTYCCQLLAYVARIESAHRMHHADMEYLLRHQISTYSLSHMTDQDHVDVSAMWLQKLLRRTCPLLREYWPDLMKDLVARSSQEMHHVWVLMRLFAQSLLMGYSFTGVHAHIVIDPIDDKELVLALLALVEHYNVERSGSPSAFQYACSSWQSVWAPYRQVMWNHFRSELADALGIPSNLHQAFVSPSLLCMDDFLKEHCPCLAIEPVESSVADNDSTSREDENSFSPQQKNPPAQSTKWGTREQFYAVVGQLYTRMRPNDPYVAGLLTYKNPHTRLSSMHEPHTLLSYLNAYHTMSRGGWWFFVQNDVRDELWHENKQQWTRGLAESHPCPSSSSSSSTDDDDHDHTSASASAAATSPIEFDQRSESDIIADRRAAQKLKEDARLAEKKRQAFLLKRQSSSSGSGKQKGKGKSK
jgi:hypothetical protein